MKKIFWVGFDCEQRNVGDHAMRYAVKKYLFENFKDYEIHGIPRRKIYKIFEQQINREDTILIQSSGDFGDVYLPWHKVRKKIIETYPENKIIQLPVSICYKDYTNLLLDEAFFYDKKNFTLLCRTKRDMVPLQSRFRCKVMFFPDFTFNLDVPKTEIEKKGILFALRNDGESLFRRSFPELLRRRPFKRAIYYLIGLEARKRINKLFGDKGYVYDPQITSFDITDENSEATIFETLKFYSRFKLVVSDRFHSWVFCYLTNTPFIPLDGTIKKKHDVNPTEKYKQYFETFRELIF